MKETKVNFGDQVSDPITGFKGIVVAITQWMYGCRRITVQPKGLGKEGKVLDCHEFDEPSLKVIKAANVPTKVARKRAETGGPRPAAKPRSLN